MNIKKKQFFFVQKQQNLKTTFLLDDEKKVCQAATSLPCFVVFFSFPFLLNRCAYCALVWSRSEKQMPFILEISISINTRTPEHIFKTTDFCVFRSFRNS